MLRPRSAILATTLLLASSACHRSPGETSGRDAETSSSSAGDAASELAPPSFRTTDGKIWQGNQEGEIAELSRLSKADPDRVDLLLRLAAAIFLHGRYADDLGALQRAIDLDSRAIARASTSSAAFLARAEHEQSLHRFVQARDDAQHAATLGADPARVASLQTELDWNAGRYDSAIVAIRRARADRPSVGSWAREAQLEHDLGHDDAADQDFAAAFRLLHDPAPLPVAQLEVQRGIALADVGRFAQAQLFFRDARARLPGYVLASDHLAETLHRLGQDEEAMALYQEVTARTDDPELVHALAVECRLEGDAPRATALEVEARATYERQLGLYPEAMWWHAAAFFLATDDAPRALALLQKNIVLRPASPGYVALARAALATGQLALARTSIDRALAMPVRSVQLFTVAADVDERAGDGAGAAELRGKARVLAPDMVDRGGEPSEGPP